MNKDKCDIFLFWYLPYACLVAIKQSWREYVCVCLRFVAMHLMFKEIELEEKAR